MQSYPLHTHNVVLFIVSSWKQTFGVLRVVSMADRTWENIDITFSSLWVRHSILITSTFGNCYYDSLHLGLSSSFLAPLPGENSVGLIFSCMLVCYQALFHFVFV